jgi:hypothetical protein
VNINTPLEFRIRFARNELNFKDLVLSDPVPLGRQLLAAGNCTPVENFSLFAILPSGDFEDVRLDEPFDIRARGAERFIAFETDRVYKLTLDGHEMAWGKPELPGSALYDLAKIGDDKAIFLEVRGGEDRLIETDTTLDLKDPGIERFITAARPQQTYEITVNSRQKTVPGKHVTFEQVVQLAFPGPHEPNVVFSMTYRHAASEPHAGELGAGGSVDVKKHGTVFNVTRAVQS